MSLLLVDGFDLYNNTTDGLRVWTNIVGGAAITTSPVRTGRCALMVHNVPMYVIRIFNPADEHATYIVGVGFIRTAPDDTEFIDFNSDGNAVNHVAINLDSVGSIRVTRGGRTGTVLGTSAPGVIPANQWHYVEAKVTLSDTVGTVTVQVDGIQVLNLTAQDTKNAGTKTVFDTISIGNLSAPGQQDCFIDDIYICNGAGTTHNDLLGECRVRTLYPNGNGANSAGVGSDGNSVNNYQLVQDVGPSTGTATYVDLANTNDEDTYAFDDLPDTSGTVAAVQISTYGQKTDVATRSQAHVTRIGGADYVSADMPMAAGSFNWQTTRQTVSPATAVAFTRAEVNGAEFGVRAR